MDFFTEVINVSNVWTFHNTHKYSYCMDISQKSNIATIWTFHRNHKYSYCIDISQK